MKHRNALLAIIFAAACCFALAACGNATEQPAQDDASSSAAAVEESASSNDAQPIAAEGSADISAADLAEVDIQIAYGDFDAMSDLSANMQNAKASGAVVEVDGLVVNYGQGMSYSIVEPNADGSKRMGVVFEISGAADDAYPADGQRAKITGVVDTDESGYSYFIKTIPEYVEILG